MGLSDAEIADTRADPPGITSWTSGELAAIELADALVHRLAVDDDLYARLREHYDEPTLIEMTHLIGWYTIVAMHVALASLRPSP